MNLKPFRDYSEHEVVNLFALDVEASKGSVVKVVSFDPDNHDGWGDKFPGVPSYAYSADYNVNATATLTSSGTTSGILGLILYDVRENLPYYPFTSLVFADPVRYSEIQAVPPGVAVPILCRGIVEISGFNGTPTVGAGAYLSDTISGGIKVGLPGSVGQIGTWLSTSGVDGFALLKVQL